MIRRCRFWLLAMGIPIVAGCDAVRLPEVEQPKPAASAPPRTVAPRLLPPVPAAASSLPSPRSVVADPLTAGSSTGDELSKKLMDNLSELEHVLAVVKDEASARRASPRIKSIVRRQAELRKAILDLAVALPAEEDARLKAQYGEQIEIAARHVVLQLQRIKALPGTKPALKSIVDPT